MKPLSKKGILSNLPWIVFFGLFFFTPVGFHIKVYVAQLLAPTPVPLAATEQPDFSAYHWQLTTVDGGRTDLSEAKGKVLLIIFWATWCPPCMAEMPDFEALYKAYGEKMHFVFVAEDTREKVEKYLAERDVELPVYFTQDSVPSIIHSKSIPATYIIDKNGAIVLSKIGIADWNNEKTRVFLDRLIAD